MFILIFNILYIVAPPELLVSCVVDFLPPLLKGKMVGSSGGASPRKNLKTEE